MIRPRSPLPATAVSTHYDSLDAFYRDLWGDHVHHGLWMDGDETVARAVERLSWEVVRRANIREGDCVCDVGCGYGGTARLIAERFGASVRGYTVSAAQKSFADHWIPKRGALAVLLQDWITNREPAESADALISIECVSHIDDKETYYREIRRVLKPGGRAVVCAWLAAEEASGLEDRWLLEPICREGRLFGLATAREHRDWALDAGLRVAAFEDVSKQVAKTWTVIAGRLLGRLATRPAYRRYLWDSQAGDRIFVLTVVRLWIAFQTGALRYGILTLEAP